MSEVSTACFSVLFSFINIIYSHCCRFHQVCITFLDSYPRRKRNLYGITCVCVLGEGNIPQVVQQVPPGVGSA